TAGSRIDQPTPATVDGRDAARKPNDGVSAPRALKPSTDVMTTDDGGGRVDPKAHLPGNMRRGG
ncbi:hypothetical protein ACFQ12_24490, partial [Methylobacterium trifolii]